MNTLKMKVLLLLSNSRLHRSIGQAVLIWIITCLGGCTALYGLGELSFPYVTSVFLSLFFSSPAVLIATSFLYRLTSFPTVSGRVVSAIGAILFTSAGITGLVALCFNLRYFEVAETLIIFVPFALISFFLTARKQVQSKTAYA